MYLYNTYHLDLVRASVWSVFKCSKIGYSLVIIRQLRETKMACLQFFFFFFFFFTSIHSNCTVFLAYFSSYSQCGPRLLIKTTFVSPRLGRLESAWQQQPTLVEEPARLGCSGDHPPIFYS